MNKLKSFFMGLILLITTFAIVVAVALIYRANDKMSIKSYIFQMNYFAKDRVGKLQDINDMPADDLRNKLIKKYISEYFKVIPGDTNVENRPMLHDVSFDTAYKQWLNGEAETIAAMSAKNMLRIVHVNDEDIVALNRPANYEYNKDPIYYTVRYYTTTWEKPNEMDVIPVVNKGVINIEVVFEPGIRKLTKDGEKLDLKEYLEENKNPAGLFRFMVTNIGDKGIL